MRGESSLFDTDYDDVDSWKTKRARSDDPQASHVTMSIMDLTPKRQTQTKYVMALALDRDPTGITSADVAFAAVEDGIHPFPKPNFTAHWLEDCRDLGWLRRLPEMMRGGMVHVVTEKGYDAPIPTRQFAAWEMLS